MVPSGFARHRALNVSRTQMRDTRPVVGTLHPAWGGSYNPRHFLCVCGDLGPNSIFGTEPSREPQMLRQCVFWSRVNPQTKKQVY